MKRDLRLAAYIGFGLALTGLMLVVPGSWAAPSSHNLAQTVPTRGPSPTFAVTFAPTEASTARPPTKEPPSAQPPTAQPPTAQPPATQVSAATKTPTPLPGITPVLVPLLLTKQADRAVVWPGLDVSFTLVLTNQGSRSVRDVVVEDALPPGLLPGVLQGTGAAWEGRTLTARTPVLAPGGSYVITFAARVQEDLAPGGIIVNQAAATATGGQRATAGIVLVLPPAELPPTGACAGDAVFLVP